MKLINSGEKINSTSLEVIKHRKIYKMNKSEQRNTYFLGHYHFTFVPDH